MLANKEESKYDKEISKFFRAFELSTEYNEFVYSKKSFIRNLPYLIKGGIEYQFLSYYFTNVPKWRVFVRKLLRKKRIIPDYIMTGPAKSGSSDLVSHLLLHPNVMHPLSKEIRIHREKDWHAYYPTVKDKQLLEDKSNQPVRCGYLEPRLHYLDGMNKLYNVNPESKIIITLRDPVSRFYSDWKYEVFMAGDAAKRKPIFQDFSIYVDRALDLFPSIRIESVRGVEVVPAGIYYKAVEQWMNRFGKDNVMVLDVAEYFKNRQPTLEKIQSFLGLPIVNIPEYGKKANENPIKLPAPDNETKAKLSEFYKPYNQKLFELLGQEYDWQ